ncbi:hypothetical protein GCM10023174_09950 [Chelativorans composti]|uniref:HTH cro/C1-type domain-containing protein n=1 Tax=Chelativorans composti TaxID=768533 RepID=A0ABW5DKS2_9HYPH
MVAKRANQTAVDRAKAEASKQISKIIEKQMSVLGLTQQQVAEQVGFNNRNMLTIIKNGLGKLPVERAPALAKALRVDERKLIRLALQQNYSPEIVNLIMGPNDERLSVNEAAIINHIRRVTNNSDPELTPDLAEKLERAFM